jgi:hypothetical protein
VMAFACAAIPGQSCAPDACSHTDDTCIPDCDQSCDNCANKCTGGCEDCKRGCKDETCRRACAEKCGRCHATCLRGLDQCTTAHCGEVATQCSKDADKAWDDGQCDAECVAVQACVEKCPDGEMGKFGSWYFTDSCALGCAKRGMHKCPSTMAQICMGDPDMMNFMIRRAQLHPDKIPGGK